MSSNQNFLKKIDSFLINKAFSKKITPFIYIFYVIISLIIVREDIGKVPSMGYLSVIIIGIISLSAAISGIRDNLYFAYGVTARKKEAHKSGYFALFIAIVILLILHFREVFFGG